MACGGGETWAPACKRVAPRSKEKNMKRHSGNDRDAKRVGVWLSLVIGLLLVGVVIFNVLWAQKPAANVRDRPVLTQPAPASEKAPGSP